MFVDQLGAGGGRTGLGPVLYFALSIFAWFEPYSKIQQNLRKSSKIFNAMLEPLRAKAVYPSSRGDNEPIFPRRRACRAALGKIFQAIRKSKRSYEHEAVHEEIPEHGT
jgi:hypothetical protein